MRVMPWPIPVAAMMALQFAGFAASAGIVDGRNAPRAATAQWITTHLDLDLTVDTAAQRLQREADLRLRLDDSTESSLTLTIGAASRMLAITGDAGITASLDTAGAEAFVTVGARRRGAEVNLHVRFVNRGQSFQMVIVRSNPYGAAPVRLDMRRRDLWKMLMDAVAPPEGA